jgi:hypothetical protein
MARDAVHDFVDGAVAARCYDFLEAFRDRISRECLRLARARRGAKNRAPRQPLHFRAQTLSPCPARGWIQNHDRVFHGKTGFRLFFKPRRRNLPACKI